MTALRICLVTPAAARSRKGNRITAVAWARTLRELGHRVRVMERYAGEPCDVLVALHARRSHDSVLAYRRRHPRGALVVVLTGTDLYVDLPDDPAAQESLRLADRLVALQSEAPASLPAWAREKTRVIVQAVASVPHLPPRKRTFDVAVVGHLRAVKDPLLTAAAARLLPADSRIRVLHAGGALEPALGRAAQAEVAANPRYHWLQELTRWQTRRLIARSRVLVHTSLTEGGANAIGEAITSGTPVLATAIPGNRGLLGADYPGCFPVGDAPALAALLQRVESDAAFLRGLEAAVRRAAPQFDPKRERTAWGALLAELPREGSAHRPRTRH